MDVVKNTISVKKMESLLQKTYGPERLGLRRELSKYKKELCAKEGHESVEKALSRLKKKIDASIKKRTLRLKKIPVPRYNPELPISKRKNEIIESIKKNPVTIISGETGSGKTTQIPKFCLAAGRGIDGYIGCTQPRRIAAVTVAGRIAEEMGVEVGSSIGYKIRFQDKTSHDAYINIMTDGILLAEAHKDPYLKKYDTIIIDEAHERSLNIDFLLGILNNLIKKRKDLKLIITSATIDTEKFSQAFNDAPVIEVSGRLYPVELKYLKNEFHHESEDEITYVEMAVKAVENLICENKRGDILIFMPTEQDIRETIELLSGRSYPGTSLMPLFARLQASEQKAVFSKGVGRKIVVATNVAETSITIPGIKYVIDTGLARISEYAPGTGTTALPIKNISKSSADQRKGRCGRVENGICIRLYEEGDYESRPLYTAPEILRSNLAEVILKMIDLGLGDISTFPFIDKPSPKSIKDGFNTLLELGAIHPMKKNRGRKLSRLTKTGKIMAGLPLDPRISRMLIQASKEGCLKEMTVIASALSISDPRERPSDKEALADQRHKAFVDPYSDFITLLNIWKKFQDFPGKERSFGKIKKFCKEYFLSFRRMKEFLDIHMQISETMAGKDQGNSIMPPEKNTNTNNRFSPLYTAIHKSVLSGYLSNIAVQKEKNIFQATKGRNVMIFPGSGLFNRAESWIVAAEMVKTSRLFARTVSNIDSSWLEEIGRPHLVRSYNTPHWEKKRGEVIAFENVNLFGITIIKNRRVSYGRIDKDEASDIFIRSALVEGEINIHPSNKHFSFLTHNKKLIANIQQMENKLRKKDLLIDEEMIFDFYKKRLKGFTNIQSLQKHLKEKKDTRFLHMKEEDLRNYTPKAETLSLFPDNIHLGDSKFKFKYTFKPGDEKDGVTIKIPSNVTSAIPKEKIDWVVPGLLEEKIEALIKGLPKEYRKKLVPVSHFVKIIVKEIKQTENALITELGEFIHSRFQINIPASAWSEESLPDHLKMRIQITDSNGKEIKSGREISILDNKYTHSIKQAELKKVKKNWEKKGIKTWDFGDLPERITIGRDHNRWSAYPALKKEENDITLKIFTDKDSAEASHPVGVAGLCCIHFASDIKSLKKDIKLPAALKKYADYFGGKKDYESAILQSVIIHLFQRNIRTEKAFINHTESVSKKIYTTGQHFLEIGVNILQTYTETRSILFRNEKSKLMNQELKTFLETVRKNLDQLVPKNFIILYSPERLSHLEKYIKALQMRAIRGFENPTKDSAKSKEIEKFTNALKKLIEELSEKEASNEKRNAIENYFWLIEEYKVSVFAQELRTSVKVSSKILEKEFNRIQRMV